MQEISYLQVLFSLAGVLALMVACAKLAQRLPVLKGMVPAQGGAAPSAKPHSIRYPLDAQTSLRIVRYQNMEYRVLHSGPQSLLLETVPVSAGAPVQQTLAPLQKEAVS
jgi:hypothetical protein